MPVTIMAKSEVCAMSRGAHGPHRLRQCLTFGTVREKSRQSSQPPEVVVRSSGCLQDLRLASTAWPSSTHSLQKSFLPSFAMMASATPAPTSTARDTAPIAMPFSSTCAAWRHVASVVCSPASANLNGLNLVNISLELVLVRANQHLRERWAQLKQVSRPCTAAAREPHSSGPEAMAPLPATRSTTSCAWDLLAPMRTAPHPPPEHPVNGQARVPLQTLASSLRMSTFVMKVLLVMPSSSRVMSKIRLFGHSP